MIYNLLSILTNTCIVRFTLLFKRKMFHFSSILITISRSLGQYKKFPSLSNYFYFFPNVFGALLHSSLKKEMPKSFNFRILLTLCVFYLLNLNPNSSFLSRFHGDLFWFGRGVYRISCGFPCLTSSTARKNILNYTL